MFASANAAAAKKILFPVFFMWIPNPPAGTKETWYRERTAQNQSIGSSGVSGASQPQRGPWATSPCNERGIRKQQDASPDLPPTSSVHDQDDLISQSVALSKRLGLALAAVNT